MNPAQIVSSLLEDDEKPGKKLPDWLAKKLGRKDKEGSDDAEKKDDDDGDDEADKSDSPGKGSGGGSSFGSSDGTVKKTF